MKRFTETTKWSNPDFRKMESRTKLLWLWLLDSCDQSGVINADLELASFQIGQYVDKEDLKALGDRLETLPNGKLLIVDFINYQCSKLSDKCPAHKPIFKLLEKHGIDPNRVCNTLLSSLPSRLQEKEKETDKEKEKEKERGFKKPEADEVVAYMIEKGATKQVARTEGADFMDFYESKGWMVGKNKMSKWRASASRWIRDKVATTTGPRPPQA
tara:strand:+ start:35903 stop:36544 length:642 start_codon:yes stop_codon:yes gene_type:complete